ncbi:N-acetylmuramoyl-L-alanine amidase [Bacillus solitudinis]|uniref:N-acetylmuramoyl-L-alanine amidase n=1 Tax=Bacillus solitudinis TaxID=2014074 RepID=UPI000C2416FD|nr:N-acetylmuramoyl-L-alanine amidase [Bacillus solitudinis]
MFKKVILTSLVVILFLPILALDSVKVSAQGTFSDVPAGTWGHDEINFLNDNRIATGYSDGTFKPNATLTRAQAAVIMTNALRLGSKTVTRPTFPDVSTDYWASGAIEQAASLGIFKGRDGRFHPSEKISKAQVATVLSRSFGLTGVSASGFSDVTSNFWAINQISALETNGIIEVSGSFEPNKAATRAEFSAFVARAIEPKFRVENSEKVLYQGKVVNTSNTLNVRSKPAMDGTIMGRLQLGAAVEVLGETGSWLKIKFQQGSGYVYRDYIAKTSSSGVPSTPTPAPTPAPTPTPPSTEKKIIAEGRVTATSLNVREKASATSTTVGKLAKGDTVSIYEYEGKWALIKYQGKWAYTHIDYLVIRNPGQDGLKNLVIAIDPGHGGKDPGAVSNGLKEKDVVLAVGLLVEKKLLAAGAKPLMTRSDDRFIELSDRSKIANNANAAIFVSIHANAAGATSANGTETFWNNVYSSDESKDLATKINTRLIESLKMKDRGVKEASFSVIRSSKMPSVLLELGFMTNSGDAAKMKEADFNERAAEAIFKGIEDYYSW